MVGINRDQRVRFNVAQIISCKNHPRPYLMLQAGVYLQGARAYIIRR